MPHYFVTVLPGLEEILADEMRVKISGVCIRDKARGKVYFDSDLPVEHFLALRTADNLYRFIHRFPVGPHKLHLHDIEKEISRLDLSMILPASSGTGMLSFKVNASRSGNHTYSRFEAAEAAEWGIMRRNRHFRQDHSGGHQLEFRLDLVQEEAVFAVRMTDAAFRYRGKTREFTPAALRPTVAHALVWVARPEIDDIFVDPCCGSGTVLSERCAYPHALIHGGDLSAEAVAAARANVGHISSVHVKPWDAQRLPLDSGYAGKVVTNLPFGKQISSIACLPALYEGVLSEMKRVLKPGGRMVCLTDAEAPLQAAAEKAHLRLTNVADLRLKGLHPSIYLLEKD
ncbi:23S rRNA G2445 N2-methylase RlmL [Paenibacillus rhizosphaerae]|uniref:23S rRNA G2445 N2-methylase RlmL n=1 Tax=Paenibacillus rhizosphaerae TaxID=297318 RepID=A0A839TQC3_9BACL|nr:methyltransferase domain-containing protein [Paenibacillus rhizosphaerae]MBB3128965.1 23S rRNA G2445 N2-methylase RlmL [Paenibacillus rhizosphaerae]